MSEVAKRAEKSILYWLPNVILINAGANDATQDGAHESVDGTGARMKQMINGIFSTVPNAGCPFHPTAEPSSQRQTELAA